MKYIVIGLGNFGSILSTRLTQIGHEVIGVDHCKSKAENLKDSLATVMTMDASDPDALKLLPFDQIDMTVIAIGENFSASIQIVTLLRQMKVEHVVARALNELHRTVLQALGVERVIFPEQEAAEVMAQSFELPTFLSSYKIDQDHYVMRFSIPPEINNKTIAESGIERENLNLLAVLREREEKNTIGITYKRKQALDSLPPDTVLTEGDIIVVYGTLQAYNAFTKSLRES